MKIITLQFLISITWFNLAHSSVLKPSEIEALQQEFENLDKYNAPTTYSLPEKTQSSPTVKERTENNTQFVDLDSVFDEDFSAGSAPAKRKRQ